MSEITPVDSLFPPEAAPTSSSVDSVYQNLPTPAEPAEKKDRTVSPAQSMRWDMENKRLAGQQFTTPYIEEHKDKYLGEATEMDNGYTYYHTDDDKERKHPLPAMNDKHVVLRDPEDGKYKVYERTPETDLGPVAGRMMGLGRFVQEGFSTSTPIGGAVKASAAQQAVRAGSVIKDTTGVDVAVPKVAADPGYVNTTAARIASHVPGGSSPLVEAAGRMRGGLDEAASTASELPGGIVSTPADAGQAAKFGINERIKPGGLFADKTEQLYQKVESMTTADRAPVSNTGKAAQDILDRFSATEQSGMPESVQKVLGAVTHPEGLTYQGMKALRTQLGEDIGKAGVNPNARVGELKQLYGALTEDMKGALKAQGGPKAVTAWEKANNQAEVFARQKEKLATILGSETKSDESIFSTLLRKAGSTATADAKTLALAKRSMAKSEWSEVVSASVAKLGRGTDGAFSPDKFVRDYNGLSPAGKNILLGSGNARLRRALDSISQLSSETWPAAKELSHPPGEMSHLAALFGVFHHISKFLGISAGANVVSRILSRPATAENVAKWMQSQKLLTLHPTKGNIVAFNNATKTFANDAAEEARDDIGSGAAAAGNFATNLIGSIMSGIGK